MTTLAQTDGEQVAALDAGPGRSDQVPDGTKTTGDLASKLDHLFRTVRNGEHEFSYGQVSRALKEASGDAAISGTYVWQLRRGERDNPRMSHLIALARFFHVDPAYFFPGELGELMSENLAVLESLRDPGVRELAVAAAQLDHPSVEALRELIDRMRTKA